MGRGGTYLGWGGGYLPWPEGYLPGPGVPTLAWAGGGGAVTYLRVPTFPGKPGKIRVHLEKSWKYRGILSVQKCENPATLAGMGPPPTPRCGQTENITPRRTTYSGGNNVESSAQLTTQLTQRNLILIVKLCTSGKGNGYIRTEGISKDRLPAKIRGRCTVIISVNLACHIESTRMMTKNTFFELHISWELKNGTHYAPVK